jgi:hypothetical protein
LQIFPLLLCLFVEDTGMKYPPLIILLMLLSSCGHVSPLDSVVSISGYQGSREIIRGMGVCIARDRLLTSAHVVRDDRLRYEVWGMRHEVWERDFDVDIAYMKMNNEQWTMSNVCDSYKEYVWKAQLTVWESISIPVIRSGSLVALTGVITSLTGAVLAYDSVGRTQVLSWLILTDIPLSLWDSGAPILDEQGRVIDVVHVAE